MASGLQSAITSAFSNVLASSSLFGHESSTICPKVKIKEEQATFRVVCGTIVEEPPFPFFHYLLFLLHLPPFPSALLHLFLADLAAVSG